MNKININFYVLTIFLLLSLTPFIDIYFLGLYNEKRGFQIIFLIAALFLTPKLKLTKNKYNLLLLFIILTYTSVIFSSNKLQSLLNSLHFLLLLNLINFGFSLGKSINKLPFLIAIVNILAVSLSLLNYSFYILSNSQVTPDDILYGFYNIRFFNQFQVLCIPFIIYFLQHKQLSRVAFTLLTLNIFLLFLSGARGAIFASLVMLAIGGYYHLITKMQFLKILKCSLLALVLFSAHFLFSENNESINYLLRTSSSLRIEIWGDLLSHLKPFNILIGNGPGIYYSKEFGNSHPHNSIFQLLYNWGGVVTLSVIVFFIILFKYCIVYIRKHYVPEFNTCLLALLALLAYSLVSGIIVMAIPQTFIFILVGILLFYLPLNLKANKSSRGKITLYFFIGVFYVFLAALSYTCVASFNYGPNFWSNGQISFSQCKIIR